MISDAWNHFQDFQLNIVQEFSVAVTHLQSWQTTLIKSILKSQRVELKSLLEEVSDTKDIISEPNEELSTIIEEDIGHDMIVKSHETVNIVNRGTSYNSVFKSDSQDYLKQFVEGFISTVQKWVSNS